VGELLCQWWRPNFETLQVLFLHPANPSSCLLELRPNKTRVSCVRRVSCAVCVCGVYRVSCVVCRVSCVVCRVSCVVCRVSCVVCRVSCVVCCE
jgi:hypothetical protein